MSWVIGFGIAFALCVLALVRNARKAGPRQLPPDALHSASTVLRVTDRDHGAGWQRMGTLTSAEGLKLKFEHNDDPQAEATLFAPGVDPQVRGSALANVQPITLAAAFETHHVHTGGFVFRVRARGTGGVIGKQTCLQMVIHPEKGTPIGGRIENDDSYDAAVGDWIEIESAEILRLASAG